MIKQATILLFVTILFTGCTERGPIPKPTIDPITPILIEEVKKQTSVSTTKVIKEEKTTINKIAVIQTESPKKDLSIKSNKTTSTSKVMMKAKTEKVETGFFSSLSDETKNNISGFFVILIGIIILL